MGGTDALAYIASVNPAPVMTHSCLCGARQYPSEAAQHEAEPNGYFKCPTCHTFATDHSCRCSEDSDGRCWDCDTRHGSHGKPPTAARCATTGHAAYGCAGAAITGALHKHLRKAVR